MDIIIKSSDSLAIINSKGAELSSFKDVLGNEYVWQKDPAFWGSSSPLLFPIVGNLKDGKVKIEGSEYSLNKHGFLRNAEFKVSYTSENKVIFNYTYNEDTLLQYPYKFSINLTYSVVKEKLIIKYDVLNLDDKDIYYCLGAHPAFNVPVDNMGEFSDYKLVFNKKENASALVYNLDNLYFDVNNRKHLLNNTDTLDLKYDLFDDDAVYFDSLNSNSVKLVHKIYGRGIQVDYDNFSSIAFWTPIKKNAPFLCIEPWNGSAVRNDEDDNFENKHGVIKLAKNEQSTHTLTIMPL